MVKELARMWWLVTIRGVVTLIFGLLALAWPGMTLALMVTLFGLYLLINGIVLGIVGLLSIAKNKDWWVMILEGLLGLIIGGLILEWPGLTIFLLVRFVAIWAIVSGAIQIITAIFFRREVKNEWLMGLSGVVSFLFGLILFSRPISGIIVLSWMLGFYALAFGIFLVALSLQLKSLAGSRK